MIRKSLFSTLILAAFSLTVCAQAQQVASVLHDRHLIKSQILGEERTVLVRVPPNYARTDEKFPVVYMLDAHPPQNSMMVGIIEQQVWGGMMPEVILVGIQNTNRTRDLTPTKTERAGSGGGDKFLQFLETEVIPLVEKNYRTQPFRIFAGHSLGGLTVVYSFLTRPDLFNAYIAASPSLIWDNNFVIGRAEEVFKQKKEYKKTMFLALGNEPELQKGFNSFRDLLDRTKPKDFEYEFRQLDEENHGSVVLPAYYWGLRKIFAGWTPPPTGTVEDLENHYKKLSERFGYAIRVPEELLNRAGYQFLRANRAAEAIEVFRKNVGLYPNSANVYDSLAEAYEKNGQMKQARENYEKAYKMAEAKDDAQLAKTAKENHDRISNKMK
ncbi:MAG TPA: alpha/beta hydrolase-fold protein [Pyrinomonadaceae bacterium]